MSFSSEALPPIVNYNIPPSLSESATSKIITILPTGNQVATGVALPTTVFTANGAGAMAQTPFGQTNITFDIPVGMGNSTFYDPKDTQLSARLVWSIPATASTVTGGRLNLIGSAASFIDQIQVSCQGQIIETINGYKLLHNLLLNSTVNFT